MPRPVHERGRLHRGQLCALSKQCASSDPERDSLDDQGRIVRSIAMRARAGRRQHAQRQRRRHERRRKDAGGAGHDSGTPDSGAPSEFTASHASNVGSEDLPAAPDKDLRIASDCSFNTDDGTFGYCGPNTPDASFFDYEVLEPKGASRLALMRVRSLQIDMGGVLRVSGNLPLVVVADQTVRIFGRLSAASHDTTPYAGGFTSRQRPGRRSVGCGRPVQAVERRELLRSRRSRRRHAG